jgi:hypothetical protein
MNATFRSLTLGLCLLPGVVFGEQKAADRVGASNSNSRSRIEREVRHEVLTAGSAGISYPFSTSPATGSESRV